VRLIQGKILPITVPENRGYILYGASDRHGFSIIHYLNAYLGYHTYDLEQVPYLHNPTAIIDPCSHSITRNENPQSADKHPLEQNLTQPPSQSLTGYPLTNNYATPPLPDRFPNSKSNHLSGDLFLPHDRSLSGSLRKLTPTSDTTSSDRCVSRTITRTVPFKIPHPSEDFSWG